MRRRPPGRGRRATRSSAGCSSGVLVLVRVPKIFGHPIEVSEEQFILRGFAHRRELLIRAGRRALEQDDDLGLLVRRRLLGELYAQLP